MPIKMSVRNRHLPEETRVSEFIDETTSRVRPTSFLGLALGSIAVSASLAMFANRRQFANFVGLWAPTFMLFGIYNKLQELEHEEHEAVSTRKAA